MKKWNDLINYLYIKNQPRLDNPKYDNISLALQKLIKSEIVIHTKNKKDFLDSINKAPKVIENFKKRIQNQVENLEKCGYENIFKNEKEKCLKLKTASRLVVGLGAGHVLETSLTLHHIFGIPYIPGSALKGVVRMVNFWEIVENNKNNVKDIEKYIKELQEQLYEKEILPSDKDDILKHKLLFGAQNFKGLLIFLDAYPEINENQQIFELDVMTPHYQGYYTQNQPPGDWENPNPITFLTVKKGINFCFNVLFDKYRAENITFIEEWRKNNYSDLISDVKNWLEKALKEFGVGAKTRLGYGIFEE